MNFWKTTFLTVAALFSLCATVLLTSCEKDACTQLTCRNGGTCNEGFCRCQDGYSGAECELRAADRFLGTYIGYVDCTGAPKLVDTAYVWLDVAPKKVKLVRTQAPNDTLRGDAVGNTVMFTTGLDRTVKAVNNDKQIVIYLENNGTNRSVCKFEGYRP